MYLNSCVIAGNIGQDPVLSNLPSGKAVLRFSIAYTEKWNDQAGQKHEKTQWFSCSLFDKRAEGLAPHLFKGQNVLVMGSVELNEYQSQDGTKKAGLNLKVDQIKMITFKDKGNTNPQSGSAIDQAKETFQGSTCTADDIPF